MATTTAAVTRRESDLPLERHRHRLRHLQSIQIRNLTPFPARDALNSSLANSSSSPLHFTDDIELALSRRRSRRISATSLGTLHSMRSGSDIFNRAEGGLGLNIGVGPIAYNDLGPGRPRANSRPLRKSLQMGHPQRPQRDRAPSSVSVQSLTKLVQPTSPPPQQEDDPTSPTSPTVAAPSNNVELQRVLEQVVALRLVETFLSLETLPEDEITFQPNKSVSREGSPTRSGNVEALSSRLRSSSSSSRISSPREKLFPREGSTHAQGVKRRPNTGSSIHTPSPKAARTELAHAASTSTSHALPTPAPSPPPEFLDTPSAPFYISGFHRPSTNPTFASFDFKHDFAPWVDLGGHKFRAVLWGKGAGEWGKPESLRWKGKHTPFGDEPTVEEVDDTPASEWTGLVSWDVDMDELKPLPSEYATQPSLIPSNTLVVRLSPRGDWFYVPSPTTGSQSIAFVSEPPSPAYSDTEINYATITDNTKRNKPRTSLSTNNFKSKKRTETKVKKSAGFHDLLELVTIQATIDDTQTQLEEIIESCNQFLEYDTVGQTNREIAQRGEAIELRNEQLRLAHDHSAELGSKLQQKRANLQERRKRLSQVKKLHEQEKEELRLLKENVDDQKSRLGSLQGSLLPVRVTLLQAISFIFPIEPLEPKDLLFQILSAPLPIPVGANDPAPPLTLQGKYGYNDETMAGALGYVAQVINFVAAYMGDMLVYPVVCLGSRSLIKDPVSAMMGPRVFPLYSRGVEIYRFEYGVFLLNKNIEMLMNERNLRALDLRHTLPNLKNLLLTLTSGDAAVLKPRNRKKNTFSSSRSNSQMTEASVISASDPPTPSMSPSPAQSEFDSETDFDNTKPEIAQTLPTTPTASKVAVLSSNSDTGASTPGPGFESGLIAPAEPSPNTAKKAFYSPIAAFLRARYPSVRTTSPTPTMPPVKVEVEPIATTNTGTNGDIVEFSLSRDSTLTSDDADETSTIKGSIRGKPILFSDDFPANDDTGESERNLMAS